MRSGFEHWSRNRPSIQDTGPEERSTASPAVGRGAGLFVALGTSTHDTLVRRRGSQLAPKYLSDPIRTTVRSSEYCGELTPVVFDVGLCVFQVGSTRKLYS